MMDHHIDETRLVSRKGARDQIHLAWNYECAYCSDPLGRSPTLDHVVPKINGGLTVRANLISCCLGCNSRKGKTDWLAWYRGQEFWTAEREWAIANWLNQ
jgi:5-methylcytosine-specific restriction endonuclease McrA